MLRFRSALDTAYGARIERVVLFGSRARGDQRPDSDYDVAVFLKDDVGFGGPVGRRYQHSVRHGRRDQRSALEGRRSRRSDDVHGRGAARRGRPVTPEIETALARAQLDLDDARRIAAVPVARFAARAASSAAFHAAEALMVARTGKIAKTHSGVRSEFDRPIKAETADSRELGRVLKDGCRFKEVADYWADPERVVSDHDAAAMIAAAQRFIDRAACLPAAPHPGAKG